MYKRVSTFRQQKHPIPWKNVSRMLAIRLDNMGDVLMTSPALDAITQSHPHLELTLLTSPSGAEIASFLPSIHHVIPFISPWTQSSDESKPQIKAQEIQQLIRYLQFKQFDAVIIHTVYSQSALPAALVCTLAGIPYRIAYAHENPYALVSHWIPDPEPLLGIKHEVVRQIDLVRHVGIPVSQHPKISLTVRTKDGKRIQPFLQEVKKKGKLAVILHPGATEKRRRYSIRRYIQVVRRLITYENAHVFITGTEQEGDLIAQITKAIGKHVTPLAGTLSLGEYIALVQQSSVLITNNTGPAHIAAAVQTPVVVLYANTNPQHTPWTNLKKILYFDVPCKACERGVCTLTHNTKKATVHPKEIVDAVLTLTHQKERESQYATY